MQPRSRRSSGTGSSAALGGRRGMVEGAVPTLGFTVTLPASPTTCGSACSSASASRSRCWSLGIAQRQPVQFVVNSLVGIGIAAVFASRTGKAEDVFLPGILYNAVYAVVLTLSVLVRWPVVGLMLGVGHRRPHRLAQGPGGRQALQPADPGAGRAVHRAGRRAVAALPRRRGRLARRRRKIALGWPLQVAALAAMVWLLARGRTPINRRPPRRDRRDA